MPAPKAKNARHPRAKPRKQAFGIVQMQRSPGTAIDGGEVLAPPACPALLGGTAPLPATRDAWDRVWCSNIAAVLDRESDMEAVVRWATLLDERERALRQFRRKRMVKGSMGQQVLSPLWDVVRSCDTELRALEDRIGLSPKARLQLGITYAEAAGSLDELGGEEHDDAPADDPRLKQEQPAEAAAAEPRAKRTRKRGAVIDTTAS
jgi:hypothetical protein